MCFEKRISASSTTIFRTALQLRNSLFAMPMLFIYCFKKRFKYVPFLLLTLHFDSKGNRCARLKSIFCVIIQRLVHSLCAVSSSPSPFTCCPYHCSSSSEFFHTPSALGVHMLTSPSVFNLRISYLSVFILSPSDSSLRAPTASFQCMAVSIFNFGISTIYQSIIYPSIYIDICLSY